MKENKMIIINSLQQNLYFAAVKTAAKTCLRRLGNCRRFVRREQVQVSKTANKGARHRVIVAAVYNRR